IGAAAYPATPHQSKLEGTSARITRSPGPNIGSRREQTPNVIASAREALNSTPSRREKSSSTDEFGQYRESRRARKAREARSVGGLQNVGRHRHRHLEAFAVAHDAEVDHLARLKVAHPVLKVEKVGHPR